jgi:uncharacterized protein YecE (DUF72 family)
VRVGTQGWSYGDWSGPFYPPAARPGDWLELYARAFDIVEVDSTFYGPPPPERFDAWRERTPDGFTFTVKMPGEVTHEGRLRDARPALRFCEDARRLAGKLGAILIQLPPDFAPAERDAVAAFLPHLPADLPFVVEFRDRRWWQAETLRMVADAGMTVAVSMGPWIPEPDARVLAAEVPGSLLYLRWLGTHRRHPDHADLVAERDGELVAWAERIRALRFEQVYAFFNNDYQGHGPRSARTLQEALGQQPAEPPRARSQLDLFG